MPGAPARPGLDGRVIVVTRPADQAPELIERFVALGARVIEAPCVAITLSPLVAIEALAAGHYEWVVVTSPNGVAALGSAPLGDARLAVVGPGTAQAATGRGHVVSLVAPEAFGASLVDAFPVGTGQVLVAHGDRAGSSVPDGLRAKGWAVDAVITYRNEALAADPAVTARLAAQPIDASVFLSGSAVRAFVDAYGRDALGDVVVCIGPSTAAACTDVGVPAEMIVVADPHTLDGIVDAVSGALVSR